MSSLRYMMVSSQFTIQGTCWCTSAWTDLHHACALSLPFIHSLTLEVYTPAFPFPVPVSSRLGPLGSALFPCFRIDIIRKRRIRIAWLLSLSRFLPRLLIHRFSATVINIFSTSCQTTITGKSLYHPAIKPSLIRSLGENCLKRNVT